MILERRLDRIDLRPCITPEAYLLCFISDAAFLQPVSQTGIFSDIRQPLRKFV